MCKVQSTQGILNGTCIKFRNQPLLLVNFNAGISCIIEPTKKPSPDFFEAPVGGGGIGQQFRLWVGLNQYSSAGMATWAIVAMVWSMDTISARARERLV